MKLVVLSLLLETEDPRVLNYHGGRGFTINPATISRTDMVKFAHGNRANRYPKT
jgi:hypothetical protein